MIRLKENRHHPPCAHALDVGVREHKLPDLGVEREAVHAVAQGQHLGGRGREGRGGGERVARLEVAD